MDSLDDPQGADPLVTFPDSETDDDHLSGMASSLKPLGANGGGSGGILVPNGTNHHHHQALMNGCAAAGTTVDTVKFEQKKMTSESKTKVTTDGFSSEQATINSAESKKLQAGDLQYQEQAALAATSSRMEVDGVTAEEKGAILKVGARELLPHQAKHDSVRPQREHINGAVIYDRARAVLSRSVAIIKVPRRRELLPDPG